MRLPTLEIGNPLLHPGEEVEIELLAEPSVLPELTVRDHYLQDSSSAAQEVKVEWHEDTTAGAMRGQARYRPAGPGSHLLELAGLPAPLPARYFGVATPDMAVCNAFMNGAFFGSSMGSVWDQDVAAYYTRVYDEIVHPLNIPFDYHVGGKFRPELRDLFTPFVEFEYLYGDTIVPMATTVNFGHDDLHSLWELTEEQTVAAIESLQRLWVEWGFRPLEVLNIHWCMGNVTMRAARRCGLKVLAALVENYYMRDGESREIATGTPLRPYYMDEEDFRKAGRRTDDALLCTVFSVVIPTNFHGGNVDAHWATDIQMVWDRSIESGPRAYRSAEVLDMLCDQPRNEVPLIFPMGMQNFGPPAVYENNCNSMRYAIQKAREGKLVFATTRTLRDYYLRHVAEQPETVSYTRDFMVGSWLIDKPIHHPDVIQMENAHFHAAFNRGEALPDYLYNYDRTWDYPDEQFRDLTKFGPEPERTEGVRIHTSLLPEEDGARLVVEIQSDREFAQLPVALWEVSHDLGRSEVEAVMHGTRLVPVTAALEGSQHALALGPVQAGSTRWEFLLRCPRHSYTPHLRTYHNLVGLKTTPNPGRIPYTYVWTELPGETTVRLRLPEGQEVWAEYYDGGRVSASRGELALPLSWPRPWVRVWNARAEELEIANGPELDLQALDHLEEMLEKYPLEKAAEEQAVLDQSRQELAQRVPPAEAEHLPLLLATARTRQNRYIQAHWADLVTQRREWFREMLGEREAGEVLVAAHAYVKGHLGGPWRDKADLEDVMDCAPGVEFSIPIYDYAVSWAPGYAAWHMGRAFTLRLAGLSTYQDERVVLHLHGYDYDRLGRAYSVCLAAREIAGGLPVEVKRVWIPSAGPEGRDDRASLASLSIPPEFLALDHFDIVVMEGYLARGVDMRKQVPYSVAISDVWVTRHPSTA